jgi:hypothetical protein
MPFDFSKVIMLDSRDMFDNGMVFAGRFVVGCAAAFPVVLPDPDATMAVLAAPAALRFLGGTVEKDEVPGIVSLPETDGDLSSSSAPLTRTNEGSATVFLVSVATC